MEQEIHCCVYNDILKKRQEVNYFCQEGKPAWISGEVLGQIKRAALPCPPMQGISAGRRGSHRSNNAHKFIQAMIKEIKKGGKIRLLIISETVLI
jgi:hypothetical protein